MEEDPKGVIVQTLTVREVAEALRVDRKTVAQMIASGDLPALKSGRIVRIDVRALEKAMGLQEVCEGQQEVA